MIQLLRLVYIFNFISNYIAKAYSVYDMPINSITALFFGKVYTSLYLILIHITLYFLYRNVRLRYGHSLANLSYTTTTNILITAFHHKLSGDKGKIGQNRTKTRKSIGYSLGLG